MKIKEKQEIEKMFMDMLLDSIQAIKIGIDDESNGCWVYDGGFGEYLQNAGSLYMKLIELEAKE